jgi:hypothetical protein
LAQVGRHFGVQELSGTVQGISTHSRPAPQSAVEEQVAEHQPQDVPRGTPEHDPGP